MSSYPVCGDLNEGVEIGEVITVNCAASTAKYRYVIIQSLDTRAEKMCIAEACIKRRGQCEITFVLVQQQCCI